MKTGSLSVVGTGIHINQLTIETRDEIEAAEKVFFLVVDPITAVWIMRTNASAESLQDCYAVGKERLTSYREMAERILAAVRSGLRVCAVFYGHPGVFVTPSHKAIKQARAEGFKARMLPAVSAEDCLFADLGIDPVRGCQIFEATDFLIRSRIFDPTCSLVLFQIGVIGDVSCPPDRWEHSPLNVLVDYLLQYYEPSHPVVLYEAAQMSMAQPVIIRCALAEIDPSMVRVVTTLYVYPCAQRIRNEEMMEKLGMSPTLGDRSQSL